LSDGPILADSERPNATRSRRLRVVYCTRGGIFGALVLNRLQACEQIEVCGIVRSSRMFHPRLDAFRGALAYIGRSGVSYALYLLYATTIADLLCKSGSVECVPTRSRPGGPPVHITRDINDPVSLSFLSDCAPNLLVSAFFDQRLHEPALGVTSHGCLNIHPSLLPEFRGVDPVLQARLRGADVGVTVHYMTPVLDQGAILAQRPISPDDHASIFATTATLFSTGAELLVSQIERLQRSDRGSPQPSGGSYQSWPTRSDIRALRTGGGALLRLADFKLLLTRSSHRF
jgi:methionyl-tRNA formyltransferase